MYTNLSRALNLRFQTSLQGSLYKRPKKAIFPSFFFTIFSRIFRIFRAAHFNFPSFFAGARAWAQGTGPGPGPGPAKKDGKCFFFSARVFSSRMVRDFDTFLLFFYIFLPFFHIFGPWRGQILRKRVGNPFWNFLELFGFWKISSRDQVGC